MPLSFAAYVMSVMQMYSFGYQTLFENHHTFQNEKRVNLICDNLLVI